MSITLAKLSDTTTTNDAHPTHANLYNVPVYPVRPAGVSLAKTSDYVDGYGHEYAVGE